MARSEPAVAGFFTIRKSHSQESFLSLVSPVSSSSDGIQQPYSSIINNRVKIWLPSFFCSSFIRINCDGDHNWLFIAKVTGRCWSWSCVPSWQRCIFWELYSCYKIADVVAFLLPRTPCFLLPRTTLFYQPDNDKFPITESEVQGSCPNFIDQFVVYIIVKGIMA